MIYSRQLRSQGVEPQGRNVQAVDLDAPRPGLDDPKQARGQSRLAAPGASHNADLFAAPDLEREAVDHGVQVVAVADVEVGDLDGAVGRPGGGGAGGLDDGGGLEGRLLGVVAEALHRHHLGLGQFVGRDGRGTTGAQ